MQGELLKESIEVGEQLALASLSSELLVSDSVQIPRSEQTLDTGRGQYPEMAIKPLANVNPYCHNVCCDHVAFWGISKGALHR